VTVLLGFYLNQTKQRFMHIEAKISLPALRDICPSVLRVPVWSYAKRYFPVILKLILLYTISLIE